MENFTPITYFLTIIWAGTTLLAHQTLPQKGADKSGGLLLLYAPVTFITFPFPDGLLLSKTPTFTVSIALFFSLAVTSVNFHNAYVMKISIKTGEYWPILNRRNWGRCRNVSKPFLRWLGVTPTWIMLMRRENTLKQAEALLKSASNVVNPMPHLEQLLKMHQKLQNTKWETEEKDYIEKQISILCEIAFRHEQARLFQPTSTAKAIADLLEKARKANISVIIDQSLCNKAFIEAVVQEVLVSTNGDITPFIQLAKTFKLKNLPFTPIGSGL